MTVEVVLTGELDISTFDKAEKQIEEAEQEAPDLLIIELAELQFVDSTGVRLICSPISVPSRPPALPRRSAVVLRAGPRGLPRRVRVPRHGADRPELQRQPAQPAAGCRPQARRRPAPRDRARRAARGRAGGDDVGHARLGSRRSLPLLGGQPVGRGLHGRAGLPVGRRGRVLGGDRRARRGERVEVAVEMHPHNSCSRRSR